jgi:hypothetical protein
MLRLLEDLRAFGQDGAQHRPRRHPCRPLLVRVNPRQRPLPLALLGAADIVISLGSGGPAAHLAIALFDFSIGCARTAPPAVSNGNLLAHNSGVIFEMAELVKAVSRPDEPAVQYVESNFADLGGGGPGRAFMEELRDFGVKYKTPSKIAGPARLGGGAPVQRPGVRCGAVQCSAVQCKCRRSAFSRIRTSPGGSVPLPEPACSDNCS